eukprot:m.114982 g.114982  ORF g.114982 m.114982 type:complete len:64 (-) comp12833_c2_seq12:3839-4030(-)
MQRKRVYVCACLCVNFFFLFTPLFMSLNTTQRTISIEVKKSDKHCEDKHRGRPRQPLQRHPWS